MNLVDLDFLHAMDACLLRGAMKANRTLGDWKKREWSLEQNALYAAKILGHLARAMRANNMDDARRHIAAIACNAWILWYHARELKK